MRIWHTCMFLCQLLDGSCFLILEHNWLTCHNPLIDWVSSSISFCSPKQDMPTPPCTPLQPLSIPPPAVSDSSNSPWFSQYNVKSKFGRSLGYLPSAVIGCLSVDGESMRSRVIFKLSYTQLIIYYTNSMWTNYLVCTLLFIQHSPLLSKWSSCKHRE